MEPEIVTADSSGPNYTPVVFDKPQFDAYVQGFSAEGQDSSKIIAEMLAEEVVVHLGLVELLRRQHG